ncbi:sugar phosphate nucleotidyltransferase [Actinomarinicola tropica]|uniref:NTP transferase domain-containing protein n=1 Tax=Actinomarinicola tropica TaxID=2789776 RepID=A0A5Q2RJ46_9ACTN|nr:NDP-sugar synthase [Actinomarinicola tropica]QGG95823.1 NTP transferase domain-containing protein [Actinomarinicola tropica]
MNAVILVGGFGTRLRPLTLTTPKQMLPVAGPTMIERVIAHLAQHGVDRAVLALGYRPDVFRDAFPDGRCHGVELVYAVEPEPLDTGGAVGFAAREASIDETFVVVNGDVLTDLDVTELVSFHRSTGAEGTIALTPVDDPSRYGVVPIDGDGRVTAFIEKPPADEAPSNWINAGTYVLEPSVLDRIAVGRKVSIEREVFPAMVADGRLFALEREGRWVDAGTPTAYIDASLSFLDGSAGSEPAVAAGAEVDPGASVRRSWIGPGASVAAGAVVEDALVLPGATIGAGAVVRRSIVGTRAVVGEGAQVVDVSVLGEDVEVAAGATLSDARVPAEAE